MRLYFLLIQLFLSCYLVVSALGFRPETTSLELGTDGKYTVEITLVATGATMDEVVVTGTMKAVSRANSPVPVEVYTADFFRANPTPWYSSTGCPSSPA